ncbi:hypothetical protein HW555_010991 [Spodoptera exigua]|uniref:Uncharacterized protein n=1 Tax=Spodoptera exigua TaxID=7107 RepID=A0A835G7T5_SPOEX|nr:hypothetical protein HW555_010991 [Spodoptera exigua]
MNEMDRINNLFGRLDNFNNDPLQEVENSITITEPRVSKVYFRDKDPLQREFKKVKDEFEYLGRIGRYGGLKNIIVKIKKENGDIFRQTAEIENEGNFPCLGFNIVPQLTTSNYFFMNTSVRLYVIHCTNDKFVSLKLFTKHRPMYVCILVYNGGTMYPFLNCT